VAQWLCRKECVAKKNIYDYDQRNAHSCLYDAWVPAVRIFCPLATTGENMTETLEMNPIAEAMSIIDRALGEMLHRELVSTNEVADLLLDIRSLLALESAVLVQQ